VSEIKKEQEPSHRIREIDIAPPPIKQPILNISEVIDEELPPIPNIEVPKIPFELEIPSVELDIKPDNIEGSIEKFKINDFRIQSSDWSSMVFKIDQLDETPRAVKVGINNYPKELKRKKIEGKVILKVEIDTFGKLSVLEVVSYTDKRFVEAAIKRAQATLYTAPKKNGLSVKTQFTVPVIYKIEKE
jgi:TonB family protein